jgi:GR25 family glycosyltransferase involved in LPS biosynthesis
MSVNFSCKGLYINLDRSVERRQAMEDQLRRIRLADRYERFAAIDAPDVADHGRILPGEAACFHSHYQALMKVKSSGSAVHILEDDVLLSPRLGEAAHAIVTSNFFNGYDVIFTDTFVHTDVLQLASY